MPRSKAKFHIQPDDFSCGPASLKTALEILDKKYTLNELITACSTNRRHGTSVINLIKGINSLGYPVLAIEWATLRHLQSALKPIVDTPRAVIMNYQEYAPTVEKENGHYATVAKFSSRTSRIFLFDTNVGGKKSYKWTDFIDIWWDFDYRRIKNSVRNRKFKLARKYYNRLMIIIAKKVEDLPVFKTPSAKLFI